MAPRVFCYVLNIDDFVRIVSNRDMICVETVLSAMVTGVGHDINTTLSFLF